MNQSFEEKCVLYNSINNKFDKCLLFHVGIDAGFHSEVDAMMQCMLYCYHHKIKFKLYADDANFCGGKGWSEFFKPFCEENHDKINHYINMRFKNRKRILWWGLELIGRKQLKKKGIDYLTQDIFPFAIDRKISQKEHVKWAEFGIDGCSFDEFAKIGDIALQYNGKTWEEITKRIQEMNLPSEYMSIQLRGGDKLLEFEELNDIETILERIDKEQVSIRDWFIFTDDYRYILKIKELRPNWNIYTLTRENEKGYVNSDFQKMNWEEKRKEMIKLFAMVEVCLNSSIHFGNEQTCVNNYIRSKRLNKGYIPVWFEEEK